jgi:hypothetical protein
MGAPVRVLTERDLNRALLGRQLLLERATVALPDALELMGCLQAQYAPSMYIGLWTRVAGFRREALTEALQDRSVVQGTLMRVTIHLVSRADYWPLALAVREARRALWLRATRHAVSAEDLAAAAAVLRERVREAPLRRPEIDTLVGRDKAIGVGLWEDFVRVPPSGTWERRRADRLGLAEDWVGPEDASEEEGLAHLVRAYLLAFGPAALKDAASWAGISATDAKRGATGLDLVEYRDEGGKALLDLPDAPLPDPDTPAPVRFLPHWDANLLVHARRAGVLPEPHRSRVFHIRNPFSVGAVLVDGRVVAAWSLRDGRIEVESYEEVARRDRDAIEDERSALEAFHR